MKKKVSYNHTIYACYLGYIVQAIVNNFAPLLFLTFQRSYDISLEKISLLVTLNFGVQLVVDIMATKFIDKIGYRRSIIIAHIAAAMGLIGLAIFPEILSNSYLGLMLAVVLYAIGGGLIEVLVSPMIEACPTEKKEAAMSLLHSFYCWGHVFVIVVSTLFFKFIGIKHWNILALIWAIVPIINIFYFQAVPIKTLTEENEGMKIKELFKVKIFYILLILMICAGASEQGMSQWASTFAESGLKVSKDFCDILGPCTFAIFMGCSRLFYGKFSEKIKLKKFMIMSSCLCIFSYLLASLTSVAILGFIGCGLGPAFVGSISSAFNDNLKKGFLCAIIFPILLIVGLLQFNSKR